MNTYVKYCPNVFVAACDEQHSRGDIIEMTTARGKTHDCEVWNYLGQKSDGRYLYSITRCDGTNRQTRAAARAQKYEDWATSAQQRSNAAFKRSEDAVAAIPFGQPILVGHHSESAHRNALKRSDAAMRKCVEESDKAESHEHKAEYWERQSEVIDLSMPESLEYFKQRLEKAEEYHAGVKSGKYPRQHAYTLTYAKKAVNDLRDKLNMAKKLWGEPEGTTTPDTAPDSQKTNPEPEPAQPDTPTPDSQKTEPAPSPIRKQVADLKAKYPDKIILMRVGDFYEAFDQDAKTIADILGLTLTTKYSPDFKESYPLAGFPHYSLDQYLPRLIRAGHNVAICDNLEDPKRVKVKETVTPSGQKSTPAPDSQKNSVTLQSKNETKKQENTMSNRQLASDKLVRYLTDRKLNEYIEASHLYCIDKWLICRPDGEVCESLQQADATDHAVLLQIATKHSYQCDCELCAPFKYLKRVEADKMTPDQVKEFEREFGITPADIQCRSIVDLYNPEALDELRQEYRNRACQALAAIPQGYFNDEK